MGEINIGKAFKVEIWEHERGWGSKIEDVKYFDTEQAAKDFCNQFNSKNTEPTAPDWYMCADYCGQLK